MDVTQFLLKIVIEWVMKAQGGIKVTYKGQKFHLLLVADAEPTPTEIVIE